MADDPILKAIQGGTGAAVADEEEQDPILAAISGAGGPKPTLRAPTLNEAMTGSTADTLLPSATERGSNLGSSPTLPLKPGFSDTTKTPLNVFPRKTGVVERARARQFRDIAAETRPVHPGLSVGMQDAADEVENAQQFIPQGPGMPTEEETAMANAARNEEAQRRAEATTLTRQLGRGKFPLTDQDIAQQEASAQAAQDAMMTGPKAVLNLPIVPTVPPGFPQQEFKSANQLASEVDNPAVPKTRGEAFFKGFASDAVKNINDMFLSPVGLAAEGLGLSEAVALSKAGQFGTQAARIGQEYEAMRAAGASGAELSAVEKQMKQAIAAAAKAQKVMTAGRTAGIAGGAAFAGQGAVNTAEGVQEGDLSKILSGAGQTILGGAGAVAGARAGGPEAQVKAATAERVRENLENEGEVTAKRTEQVPSETQKPPQIVENSTKPTVGATENLAPEKPETLKAQVDALSKGTNKVVYFPKDTENIPAPPENATVTVVPGKKAGAGTYYHTDEVTPEQIKKAVKDGTFGKILGHEQTKEEASSAGAATTVTARSNEGTEIKSSVVDASKPETVTKQAQTLQDQFPQAKVGVETPEQVVSGRQAQAPKKAEKPAQAPVSSETPQTPERRQARNAELRKRVGEMSPEEMRKELLTSKTTELPNRRAFDEAGESPAVAMSDADGLKALNDKFGYEAGNELLKAKADSLKEAGLEAYHDKGDEFLYRGESPEDLKQKLEKAREILRNKIIEATMTDGTVRRFKGADFSYGTGTELSTAETNLKGHKSEREARGERARGELRGIAEVGPEKGAENPSPERAGETEEPAVPAKAAENAEPETAKPAESVKKQFKKGDRVAYTSNGKPVTGTIESVDPERKEAIVNVDQVKHIGGRIPIGRIEFVSLGSLRPEGEPAPAETPAAAEAAPAAKKGLPRKPSKAKVPVPEAEVGQGLMVRPEATPQSGAPVRPPSARWTSDIGNIPGEPALYLDVKDDDTDSAKAAITEIENNQTPGRTTWQLTDRHGDVMGNYSTPEEAAKAAEKHWPKNSSHEVVKPAQISEKQSKVEKEETHEATEPLGEGSARPPAEVQAEDVRPTEGERKPGELSAQRGGEGEGRVHAERGERDERAGSAERSEEESPVPADRSGSTAPGGESRSQSRPGQSGNDYRITEADKIGQGSITEKFNSNVDAIQVLKELESTGRLATPEEQSKLVRYSGWGWSGNLLNEYHDKWRNERAKLKSLLTDEEYRNAVASTKNAHYTSPQVIKAVWDAVQRLGFAGGRILEPSAGVGHFFGLMPNDLFVNSRRTAIELDTVSGKILKQLYQTADARIQGFEALKGLDNFYDLAISNVPFGDYSVHDPAYNKYKLTIHNYFIAKMLDKVRPGGLVAAITSHHTLDNYKSAIRKVFLDRGDLVGAIRLPANAFKENAGTDVTTDLLLFRKRASGEAPDSQPFLELKPVSATGARGNTEKVEINEYFTKHPNMALGEHSMTGSMYGYGNNYELKAGSEPIDKLLAAAIDRLPKNVMKEAAVPESVTRDATAESIPDWGETKPFGYLVRNDKVYQNLDGKLVHLPEFPKANIQPLADLLGIRNATRELFHAEAKGRPAKELTESRGLLNRLYDAFVKKNGFINQPRNLRMIAEDPDMPLLSALEDWDAKTKKGTKTDVFFKQTIATRKEVTKVERPEDSLPASLAEKGRIDFGYMSKLTGLTPEQLQQSLSESGTIFKTPVGHWEASDEYLSGDVRKKLREAEEAAKVEPEYKRNVEALKAVQPRDLEAGEISIRLGTPWIPTDDVQNFIDSQILESRGYRSRTRVTHVASEGIWKITNPEARYNEAARTKWGTARMAPLEILEDALNLRRPTVYDRTADDKSIINEKETLAAREKLEQLEDEFKKWLFKDTDRATRLVDHYNQNYNNLADREFDGSHLTFPGMNAGITMRQPQKDGIWRSLVAGNTLLAHVVGTGKTFTIIASAMEAKRLGLAKKSGVVVPNHLVEQWASDFLKLYPQARILAATKEEWGTANRKKLMSRIATGEWDAVIIPKSSFTLLPVSDETYKKHAQKQLDMIEEHIRELTETEGKRGRTVKQLEKAKARIEARMKKALNRERKDNTINFEDTGIDRLYVDEAHAYKNLFFSSKMGNINGIPKSDAQRSFDMYLKTKYITELNNGSGVVFATGTPISNTMAEIYTMQRYMNEAQLEANGLQHFDSWAAAYGQTIQNMEVSPEDPTKFRISTRFAKFNNVAELKRQFRQNADVILAEDLKGIVKVPDIHGGKPTVIETPITQRVREHIDELGKRAKAIRSREVDPTVDNMLKITSEGRKVALDYRSMFPGAPDDGESKITTAAKKIADIYKQTSAAKSTQAVMLDLMTPSESGKKRGQFNAYADLKNKLVGLGVPANEIAFIHDAKSDEAKQALFDKVNAGEVRVILGSSDTMGVGTNIQQRLIALHHLDSPWRPSDIEQREGRIVRQGNSNPVVQIYRYVTSGTFDAYMWSTIARKADFIHEMMKHGYDVREMEDVDGASLSYAEAAAIATGDTRVLEKVKTDAEVDKLAKLKSIHEQNKLTNQVRLAQIPQRIESLEQGIEAVRDDIKTRDANASDKFRLVMGKQSFEERKDAGAALNAAVEANQGGERLKVGKFSGLDIVADGSGNLHLEGRSSYYFGTNHENPLGTIQSMEATLAGIPNRVESRKLDVENLKKDLEARKSEIDKPFAKQAELDKLLKKQKELNDALAVDKEDKTMAGASANQVFDEDFKKVQGEPGASEDSDEEEERPTRRINPRHPEAGFISGEALLAPFIALSKLVRRVIGGKPAPRGKTIPTGAPGQPKAAPEARPTERAGNIRLDKLNTVDDVLNEIRRAAKENAGEYNEQRRGKIPFYKTKDAAQRLVEEGSFTEEDLEKLKKGTALNAEELLAARGMLIASAEKVREAAKKLRGNESVDNVLAFQEALMRHSGIQKAVSGAVAEAGRALSQQRIIANALKGKDKSLHERILEGLDKELSAEAAARLAAIPEDDHVAAIKFLRSQKEWTTANKLEAYWIANVLSSPRTPIKKVLGDVVLGSVETGRRFVDVPVDKIMAAIQGRKSETTLREAAVAPFAYVSAMPEGIRKAAYIMSHGFDPTDPLVFEMPHKYEFPGGAKNPFNIPGRALSAATKFFQVLAFQGELHAQAVRQAAREGLRGDALKNRAAALVQNPTDTIIDEAMKASEFQTYTERPDALSRVLMTLRDKVEIPRGVPLVGGLHPLRFVIPFVQIPYNLAKQSVRYSPLGALRMNDFSHAKSPEATKTISRALIGTAIIGALAYLAAKNLLTGGAPKDAAARDEFYRSGKQPYSVKIGNRWVSYKPAGPFALTAAAVAGWHDRKKKKENQAMIDEAWTFAGSMGGALLDESFLRGLKNLMDAMDDPEKSASRFASGIVGGFVPMESALRTLNDSLDPTVRSPKDMYERIIAGLPVINKNVAPKLDALGRPSQKEGSSGFAALFPGGFAKDQPFSDLDAEIDRLNKLGLKNVGFPGKHLTIDNYRVDLSSDEQSRYAITRGAYLRSYLKQTFDSPDYKKMTDEGKIEAAEEAIREAGQDARQSFGDQVIAERLQRTRSAAIPRKPPKSMAVAQ